MKFIRFCLALLFLTTLSFTTKAQVFVKRKPIQPKNITHKPSKAKANHVWIDGHWKYDEKRKEYVWVDGHWMKENKGHDWVPGHWQEKDGGFVWVPGHWRKHPAGPAKKPKKHPR